MRLSFLSALSLSALAATASAQYVGEGPFKTVPSSNDNAMRTAVCAAIPVCTGIAQINFTQISGTSWYACVTATINASVGTLVYAGTWDTATGTFVRLTDADSFNALTAPNINPFALGVSNDRLVAVCDTAGSTYVATRASTAVPFGTPVALTGVPAGGYLDSNLAVIKGQLSYLHVSGQDIWAGDLNPATAVVSNTRKIVTNPIGFSASHSPSAIRDAAGVARALLFASNGATGADAMFTSSMEDLAGKFLMEDHTAWINNGGAIGGTVYYADSTGNYVTNGPRTWSMTCTGSTTVPFTGGSITLTNVAPYKAASAVPFFSAMLLGTLNTGGTPIPGVQGNLALSLLGLVSINMPNHDQNNGLSQLTFSVGALPPGGRIDYQNVMLDLIGNVAYLGSSGQLDIQ